MGGFDYDATVDVSLEGEGGRDSWHEEERTRQSGVSHN